MAYSFSSASSQYLSIPTAVVSAPPLTICAWQIFPTLPTTANPANDIVSLSSQTSSSVYRINYNPFNNPPMRLADAAASGSSVYFGSPTANTWFHYAGVFTSTTSRTPYFNGTAGTTDTTSVTHSTLPTHTTIGALFAGTSTPIQFNNGRIAEVGIWNAALSAAEIASLAKGMTCDKVRPQNLVFYAPLVRALVDQKGGLALTNNNGATVANHPRVYA